MGSRLDPELSVRMRFPAIPTVAVVFSLGCAPSEPALGRTSVGLIENLARRELDSGLSEPAVAGFARVASIQEGVVLASADVDEPPGSRRAISFVRNGSDWTRQDFNPPGASDLPSIDAIALSSTNAALGSALVDGDVGAVWVFEEGAEAALLKPSGSVTPPGFGAALALDNTTLMVGAPSADGAGAAEGAVFVYERSGDDWEEVQVLRPTGPDVVGAAFGLTIALRGKFAAVAAAREGGLGAVYLYRREATWSEVLRTTPAAEQETSFYGKALAMTEERLFVGAPAEDSDAGAAYVWKRSQDTWELEQRLVSETPAMNDGFGSAIGAIDSLLLVGVPFALNEGIPGGRVESFMRLERWEFSEALLPPGDEASERFGRTIATSGGEALIGAVGRAFIYSQPLGAACSADLDCDSGACVQGVCCESQCDSPCVSCLAAHTQESGGEDGHCLPVDLDTDPRDACSEDGDVCGEVGSCDGKGECALATSGVKCAEVACLGDDTLVGVGRCDGAGSCTPGAATSCDAGFLCRAGSCGSQCAGQDDCDRGAGYYCYEGACVSGARCSDDRFEAIDTDGTIVVCESTLCSEGVCPETCERSRDCREGLVCDRDSHQCVPLAEVRPRAVEAGCNLSAKRSRTWLLPGLFCGAVWVGVRRLRSRKRN